jgi:hypothetical protein
MPARTTEWSPRARARLAGAFEALEGLTFTFGQVIVLGRLTVHDDAAATATNILAHESLFRLGFAFCLVGIACHIAWAVLFHDLFKPVNRSVSRVALAVMLVGCATQAVTSLLYMAPLVILHGAGSLSAFPSAQLQALALTFLKWNGLAFDTYLVFFGLWCALIGYLIVRSTFLPRILGVLLAIDGLGWMLYVSPPLGVALFPFIAAAAAAAEIPLQLWLLIAGVDSQRWKEQADAARA